MKTYIVYKITNKNNGKSYIGKTEYSLEHRWNRHLSSARNGSKFRFHSAIRKYGEDCWDLSVIETYQTEDENLINEKESHFINLFESNTKKGYNATSGGTGGWMLPRCSQEVRANWLNTIIEKSTGYSNPNWSGLTDDDMIDIGMKFIQKYGYIAGRTKIVKFAKDKLDINFPKHFSKNRFGGKHKNFYKILEEKSGLKFNPHFRDDASRKILSEKASINSKLMWKKRRETNAKD
jgi:group I intron endonuclease